jgi:hypothetical protein
MHSFNLQDIQYCLPSQEQPLIESIEIQENGPIRIVKRKQKQCFHNGCEKQPNYNYPNEKVAIFCKDHSLPDMKNIVSKICNHDGCEIRPSYNYLNETSPIFCREHKLIDMKDIVNKLCTHDGCEKQPVYNYPNETVAIFCNDHLLPDMKNVIAKQCKTNLCDTRVSNPKYEGHCLRCFMYLFPDKPVSRNYKTKETFISNFIKESFPNNEWIFDKTIVNGTSRRRPDILLELNNYNIIIEVDENQHRDYDITCENKRTMEIFRDLGNRNIVFIRFNPDDYLDNDKNITSCWGINKQGICVVKKSKTKEWDNRLNELKKQIEYWIVNTPDKEVEVIQLFYNI